VSDYTELSNDKHFHKWHASTIITTRVHKLDNIINPDFIPTPEKHELFNEKNLFFYSILIKKLVRSRAKVHICIYAKTSDGQKVFAALVIDFTTGIEGNLRVDALKLSFNGSKLDNSWRGGSFAFIAAWQHKISTS
jgi:hypothetical protein